MSEHRVYARPDWHNNVMGVTGGQHGYYMAVVSGPFPSWFAYRMIKLVPRNTYYCDMKVEPMDWGKFKSYDAFRMSIEPTWLDEIFKFIGDLSSPVIHGVLAANGDERQCDYFKWEEVQHWNTKEEHWVSEHVSIE